MLTTCHLFALLSCLLASSLFQLFIFVKCHCGHCNSSVLLEDLCSLWQLRCMRVGAVQSKDCLYCFFFLIVILLFSFLTLGRWFWKSFFIIFVSSHWTCPSAENHWQKGTWGQWHGLCCLGFLGGVRKQKKREEWSWRDVFSVYCLIRFFSGRQLPSLLSGVKAVSI